jgi:N-acetyl-gamma-glutamyl-phosphate reductase
VTGARAGVISCAVVGASGYSGAELVEILAGHPRARVVGVFGSERRAGAEEAISVGTPRLRGVCDLPLRAGTLEAILECSPDAVFLATPHAASHDLAPALAERGVVALDLSAAFRLKDPAAYPLHYGFEHLHHAWLSLAVYGMPELSRQGLAEAMLIAVPGCYPTSAILPLAPLARAGAIDLARAPIIDSTSGVSGAGRHALAHTSFCEVSLQPYGVFKHRHQPEIDAYAGLRTVFTPHLGAYDRGILSTIHVELAPGWTGAEARGVIERAYAREPFVRVLPAGTWPSVAGVRRTNFCDIGLASDDASRHLIVISALDNLVKGAAGQAVQCMNARFGMPESMGLLAGTAAVDASRGGVL